MKRVLVACAGARHGRVADGRPGEVTVSLRLLGTEGEAWFEDVVLEKL